LETVKELAEYCVDYARNKGVTYVEARGISGIDHSLVSRNGDLLTAGTSSDSGLGIRVLINGGMGFASFSHLNKKTLQLTVDNAISLAKKSNRKVPLSLGNPVVSVDKWQVPAKQKMKDVDFDTFISLNTRYKEAIKNAEEQLGDIKVPNANFFITLKSYDKIILTSEGTQLESHHEEVYGGSMINASSVEGMEQRFLSLMTAGGFEYFDEKQVFERITKDTIAVGKSTKAKSIKFDKPVDMVVGTEVAGIISHENVGHPSEGDRIMGREAAQAGESFWKTLKIGAKVGSKYVSVSDDPTLLGSPGYYKYDDEGVPARKRKLMVDGILNEPLLNRDYGTRFGLESNAAARADGYNREPIIRMASTYIEPGDFTFDELIEDVKEGIYMVSFTEWNIDDVRFQSKYVGQECYLIKNGEVKYDIRIKRPVIELTSVGLFESIDGCSKNLELIHYGNCGKGDPMQVAPVYLCGPEVRMRNIRLG
jgi:TldD protein